MSSLSSFAKSYVKDIGLTALDILKQDIARGAATNIASSNQLEGNLAETSLKLGTYFEQSFAITAKMAEEAKKNAEMSTKPWDKISQASDFSAPGQNPKPSFAMLDKSEQSRYMYDISGNKGEV